MRDDSVIRDNDGLKAQAGLKFLKHRFETRYAASHTKNSY